MTQYKNAQGQPIGAPIPDWHGCAEISQAPMQGRFCDVVPLSMDHSAELHAAFHADTTGTLWTYMPVGPFDTQTDYDAWVENASNSRDPLFFTVLNKKTGKPVGVVSFLRIEPDNGVVEVGYITFSPALKRTPMATEAMFLMMKRVFDDLGYRRYEWKCDALNGPSRKAAERFGFSYEGTFRQARVYKGRNRDTAWFSMLDGDWPRIKTAFETWLSPANFDLHGSQIKRLSDIM